ncbi:hypothetical protein BV898_17646 [Hypsibius exemplaris]|uniref:Uncharacterized protein n=1 Tax=Hypsibius exemplaris TaxID=2072580 RepID=A0A9X6NIB5_HYPEX|nr:hypothetical protein BV898_17646 [Hypsibius exemplaris]
MATTKEDLSSMMRPTFPLLLKASTVKDTGSVIKTYHDLNRQEKHFHDLEIERIFQEPFEQQLAAIDQMIERNRKVGVTSSHDSIKKDMDYAKEAYDKFLEAKTKKTRETLNHATGLLQGGLGFFPRLVGNNVGITNFFESAPFRQGFSMDSTHFRAALPKLFQGLTRIYLMTVVHHYYDSEVQDGDVSHADSSHQYLIFLQRLLEETVYTAQVQFHQLRLSFLLKTCGDPQHGHHCGAETDRDCTELGAKVYRALRENEDKMSNQQMASYIGIQLRTAYPALVWAVVVHDEDTDRDTPRRMEVQYNLKYRDRGIWLQRFGTERHSWLEKRERRNKVESWGVGDYGCFVCYRTRQTSGNMAIIFWADESVTEAPGLLNTFQTIRQNFHSAEIQKERYEIAAKDEENGGVTLAGGRLATEWMSEGGSNFMFAVVATSHNERTGNTVGMDLPSYHGLTFPMHFKDDYHQVLFWPEEAGRTASDLDGWLADASVPEPLLRKFRDQKEK